MFGTIFNASDVNTWMIPWQAWMLDFQAKLRSMPVQFLDSVIVSENLKVKEYTNCLIRTLIFESMTKKAVLEILCNSTSDPIDNSLLKAT